MGNLRVASDRADAITRARPGRLRSVDDRGEAHRYLRNGQRPALTAARRREQDEVAGGSRPRERGKRLARAGALRVRQAEVVEDDRHGGRGRARRRPGVLRRRRSASGASKPSIVCGVPSSASTKSSRVRPETRWPGRRARPRRRGPARRPSGRREVAARPPPTRRPWPAARRPAVARSRFSAVALSSRGAILPRRGEARATWGLRLSVDGKESEPFDADATNTYGRLARSDGLAGATAEEDGRPRRRYRDSTLTRRHWPSCFARWM